MPARCVSTWRIVMRCLPCSPKPGTYIAIGLAEANRQADRFPDPDVFDTWFSSNLWPFSTLGWPDEASEDYRKFIDEDTKRVAAIIESLGLRK